MADTGTPTGERRRDEYGRAFYADHEVPPSDERFAHWRGRLTHPEAICNQVDAKHAHANHQDVGFRCIGGWIPSGDWWLHCPICRTEVPRG